MKEEEKEKRIDEFLLLTELYIRQAREFIKEDTKNRAILLSVIIDKEGGKNNICGTSYTIGKGESLLLLADNLLKDKRWNTLLNLAKIINEKNVNATNLEKFILAFEKDIENKANLN